ncbi:helix-turn-helix transcriptional regulator [Marinobacter oulmenensis]|uniref:AraC-like DNA-binding protein n=1 Tax=Marinobacter oulmenensis TaxID=643747 RepID=A0A840UBT4_9GAMM|nr:AraC family transcriptional regulator [Marinobacter oulmenensis]MBB5321663.1 AraC-like DNA-binding protein [Marinobacter oulmenensis]
MSSIPSESGNQEVRGQRYRVRDFLEFGAHYAIDYRFPDAPHHDGNAEDSVVAEGCIDEHSLSSGFRFTFSDLAIHQPYESVSFGHAPLLVLVVLAGQVQLRIGAMERELQPGMAVTMQLHSEYALQALQQPQASLNTVTLAFDPRGADVGRAAPPTLHQLLSRVQDPLHVWHVPPALMAQLSDSDLSTLADLQRSLVLEGLALQLAGRAIPEGSPRSSAAAPVSSQQRERLELVRQRLAFAPHREYSFDELARLAAMSPSSLRTKFRATYGLPLFDYLRRCRLELARQYLEQGLSVQQTAHRVGYRHSTNFATAFRRQFGVSPRQQSKD